MVEAISKQDFVEGPGDPKFREMRFKLDEARFFFPADSVALFERITNLAAQHAIARVSLRLNPESQEFRAKQGDIAAKAVSELVEIYQALPTLMKKELGFAQLRAEATRS
jgi:diaminopimelate decarboxylase